jgi:8-amino-7-oxononanoate synthase
LAALRLLADRPQLAADVRARARELAAIARGLGLDSPEPHGAVCAVLIGEPEAAVAAAETCLAHGVRVGCFRPPSVPDGISRLRITARADLTPADLERALVALTAVAAGLNSAA